MDCKWVRRCSTVQKSMKKVKIWRKNHWTDHQKIDNGGWLPVYAKRAGKDCRNKKCSGKLKNNYQSNNDRAGLAKQLTDDWLVLADWMLTKDRRMTGCPFVELSQKEMRYMTPTSLCERIWVLYNKGYAEVNKRPEQKTNLTLRWLPECAPFSFVFTTYRGLPLHGQVRTSSTKRFETSDCLVAHSEAFG